MGTNRLRAVINRQLSMTFLRYPQWTDLTVTEGMTDLTSQRYLEVLIVPSEDLPTSILPENRNTCGRRARIQM